MDTTKVQKNLCRTDKTKLGSMPITLTNPIKLNHINDSSSKITVIDPFMSYFIFLGPRPKAKY